MSTLAITTIQTLLHWEDKAANLAMMEEKILSIKEKTEIVVLPEMFTTGFSMHPAPLAENMEGTTIRWMKKVANQKKIILTGSMIAEEGGKFFNRLIWMQPDGQFGYYDKRHLFGFAGEHACYQAGTKRFIASVKGWKINLQVCYDLRFPVWARQSSSAQEGPEFDLLLYVANWPERRSHAWKILLQARAIENQCYVLGVNRVGKDGGNIEYSGNTMFVDPLGAVIYHKSGNEELATHLLTKETLDEIRRKFPFLKDADHFFIEH